MAKNYTRSKRSKCAHWDKIDPNHRCINCGKTKFDIGFAVNVSEVSDKVWVKNVCNKCVHLKRIGVVINTNPKRAIFTYRHVRDGIRQYFEDEYMLFKIIVNNKQVGSVYAPNIKTAQKRAVVMYGKNAEAEEK